MTPFTLLLLLLFVAGMLLIIGLIRPGFVVFWRERKSRTSVLAVWGTATILLAFACMFYARGAHTTPQGAETWEDSTATRQSSSSQ